MKNLYLVCSSVVLLCLLTSLKLIAEGFYIDPQSAEGMGVAQAGAATGYSDASAGFYNPAALTTYKKNTVSLQLHGFNPSAKFKDRGSIVAGQSNFVQPNTGTTQANGGRDALLPLIYSAIPLSSNLTGSLYINSPFGLGTEYPIDWIGRYQALESAMELINIGSAAGVKLGSGFSLGAGLSAMYAEADLSSAVDFGSIASQILGLDQAAQLGIAPQINDGKLEVAAKDWALGWNLGLLYEYGENNGNRVGLSYRAASDLNFHDGTAKFTLPSSVQLLNATGLFNTTSARSSITLPESVTFGTKTKLSNNWTLLQQSTWTRWSQIQDFTIKFGNALQPDSIVPQDWKNTWMHALGLAYNVNEGIELRTGLAYETGMIPNATRRYPRLPTSESTWVSAGVGIKIPEYSAQLDLSFTRVDYHGGNENSTGPAGDQLVGNWNVATNALSTALTFYW